MVHVPKDLLQHRMRVAHLSQDIRELMIDQHRRVAESRRYDVDRGVRDEDMAWIDMCGGVPE